jgi:hypothetical protein
MVGYSEAEIAQVRERYRPLRITVLFVGESPPSNGNFFYFGNNDLLRHMRSAIGAPPDGDGAFLDGFKARGWFLDDLVMEPIDDLSKAERDKRCRDARSNLAARIMKYQPQAIISILSRIQDDVEIAANMAGSRASLFAVPFPGNGWQTRFREGIERILPQVEALR